MDLSADDICFGLDRALDVSSFVTYLRLLGREELAAILADRMTSEEIIACVDNMTGLLKKHLSEAEYHRYFLHDQDES